MVVRRAARDLHPAVGGVPPVAPPSIAHLPCRSAVRPWSLSDARRHAASAGRPDGGEFPRLGRMIDDDRDFLNADRLELGLQWVLDGIAARCER